MMLVIGSGRDKVFPVLVDRLKAASATFRTIDEDDAELSLQIVFEPAEGGGLLRIVGGSCRGEVPVRCIFVRHAVARTLDPAVTGRLGLLQATLNRLLAWASCPVANAPSCAFSNYSKVYQLGLLADAGFDIPETLLTNRTEAAKRFAAAAPQRQIIFKGASNMMTLAQVLTDANRARLANLPHAPTVFQERILGADLRVHVIGESWIATRLVAADPNYRRAAFGDEEVSAAAADLPAELGERCVAITRALGLRLSGIDFRVEPGGRHVVLELNPFPQFTFYERLSGQPIMAALVDYLDRLGTAYTRDSNVLA